MSPISPFVYSSGSRYMARILLQLYNIKSTASRTTHRVQTFAPARGRSLLFGGKNLLNWESEKTQKIESPDYGRIKMLSTDVLEEKYAVVMDAWLKAHGEPFLSPLVCDLCSEEVDGFLHNVQGGPMDLSVCTACYIKYYDFRES